MAMEAHKLRFVRCPKCYQLLVEYPSIPVYKCGSCNTVLRAKIRAVHAVQAKSESDVQTNVPSSLKGSPQDCNSICTDEHKIAPSVDQPREAAADGIISSPTKNTNSCNDSVEERAVSVVKNITPAQHQEETCSLIDENTQTPGITVNEMHKKGTGADSSSNLIGDLENPDTRENTNRGKVDKVDMTVMRTLDEKTEAVQREERLHTCEHMHVESHEALIEELERSLSFSSNDDEYFSDEAETNGLSDALRQQMGSRRFMLSGQPNDTSRNDPHGQLIKELEMSFSDAEEPMEQHALDADGNKHDKHLQNLDAESANPCGETICSLDNGRLESEQTFHVGNRPIDNDNEGKRDIENDNSLFNDVHGNENDTHLQILGSNSAHPCEVSTPSLDNGHLESEQTFLQENRVIENDNQGKDDMEGDNSTTNDAHGNEHIVVANEVSEETFHEKRHGKDLQPASAETVSMRKGRVFDR